MPGNDTIIWTFDEAPGPVVATAIHAGHHLRGEVRTAMALDEESRLREEDPHTDAWTEIGDARLVATHSRFQVDLNRPREGAVYRTPADAWGLEVWSVPPSVDLLERSLDEYDRFYAALDDIIRSRVEAWGTVVVLDLHAYNHRRGGPRAAPDDPAANPEINVGTGSMDRPRWHRIVDTFISTASAPGPDSPGLDVRENVRFRGGHMSRWLHGRFPDNVCALAIEVKKTFMDEWSGELDSEAHRRIGAHLASAAAAVRDALEEP